MSFEILGVDLYHILSWFIVYSFMGWIWESCYVSAKSKKWVNRGFVSGPFVTIYGVGAVTVYVILRPVAGNILELYFAGVAVATILEYVTGVLMEAIFHTNWWDYSDKKFNFQGKICLGSSVAWGFFTLLLFYIFQPVVGDLVEMVPRKTGIVLVYVWLACAVGGMITIDFADIENPAIREIKCDFDEMGHDLVIINTGKGHADLSAEYSAVPNEMKKVAEYFGKEVLEQCKEDDVIENVKAIREFAGDRAVLRAFHFFEENKRVDAEVEALEKKDFATFFNKITESGDSSWKWLQNCYCNETPDEQSITVALALTKLYLDKIGRGVCRVHGGGFAGVIAAFLPKEETEGFTKYIDKALGEGSAYVMHIRPQGAVKVEF